MRSKEAGFAVHLVKPVDAEQLVHLVETLLRKGARAPLNAAIDDRAPAESPGSGA